MNEKDSLTSQPLADTELTGATGGEFDPTSTGLYDYCAKCGYLIRTPKLTWVEGWGKLCPNCEAKVRADAEAR